VGNWVLGCFVIGAHSKHGRLQSPPFLNHARKTEESNLCLASSFCNLHKSSNLTGIDSTSGEITRLFNPRSDVWEEHFAFQWPRITGTSPVGRTTVAVLNMNDEERLELRQELSEEAFT